MYDPVAALAALDTNVMPIVTAFVFIIIAVYIYWFQAYRLAKKFEMYAIPFIGISVFWWHDLSFVLQYDKWFNVYDHWWLKLWWWGLLFCVPLESLFIWHVIKWGRKDYFSNLSQGQFTSLVLGGHLLIGGWFFFFKASMQDELYFITFVITAMWSVPFHSGIMARRGHTRTQSYAMELSTIVMLVGLTYAFSHVTDFFVSPLYLTWAGVCIAWALGNCWLIKVLPEDIAEKDVRAGQVGTQPA